MKVLAKFKVHAIEAHQGCRVVRMRPVYSDDPNSPNYSWSVATPSGDISMSITNPAAYEQFEVDGEYTVSFMKCERPEAK